MSGILQLWVYGEGATGAFPLDFDAQSRGVLRFRNFSIKLRVCQVLIGFGSG
jgi:hypothetical protein